MNLIFYIAKNANYFDRVVAFATRGPYSHAEIQLSDGMCFSSSPLDGGTRFKKIVVNPAHWVVVSISCAAEQEAKARQWSTEHQGLRTVAIKSTEI